MKIQVGSIAMNKTKKYLLPCLKYYGEDFEQKFHAMWKWAVGIGDIITIKSNVQFEKHIFILADMKRNTETFNDFQLWIREQPYYADDYAFDNLLTGHLHMFVVKLPEKFYDAFETFKKSEFSKMFSHKDLYDFFSDKPDVVQVVIKDHEYKLKFAKQLQEQFNVYLREDEIDDKFELDLPVNPDEEFFNDHLK